MELNALLNYELPIDEDIQTFLKKVTLKFTEENIDSINFN